MATLNEGQKQSSIVKCGSESGAKMNEHNRIEDPLKFLLYIQMCTEYCGKEHL